MSDVEYTQQNRAPHWVALAAGIVAVAAFIVIPSGILGYLAMIAAGVVAAVIGHGAVRRRGPLRWMAVVGLVLAYLAVICSVGVLVVGLLRMVGG